MVWAAFGSSLIFMSPLDPSKKNNLLNEKQFSISRESIADRTEQHSLHADENCYELFFKTFFFIDVLLVSCLLVGN